MVSHARVRFFCEWKGKKKQKIARWVHIHVYISSERKQLVSPFVGLGFSAVLDFFFLSPRVFLNAGVAGVHIPSLEVFL